MTTIDVGVNRVVGRGPDSRATAWDLSLATDGSFTLTGSTTLIPEQSSVAYAITDEGDISGRVDGQTPTNPLDIHAFVIRDDLLEILPNSRRDYYGIGVDLNDSDVVGATGPVFTTNHATTWDSRGKLNDLEREYFDDSWLRTIVEGINSTGEMVGWGTGGAWLLRKTLAPLTATRAIPEPSTIILALLCVTGAATYGRRVRR